MNDPKAKRLVMWSGPRNISTAMMRAFENRPDCAVWDEPFYAAYLRHSGVVHPMQEEIIAAGMVNPQDVAEAVLGAVPGGYSLYYQKHMSHHMIEQMPRDWFGQVTHGFLIRHPRRVTASYAAKRSEVTLADLGFERLVEIFDQVCDAIGSAPPILDSDATPMRAEGFLRALCISWNIPFLGEMLSWPAGRRDSDGVWGDHWYGQVRRSTGFNAAPPKDVVLTAEQERVAEAAMPYYERIIPYVLEPVRL